MARKQTHIPRASLFSGLLAAALILQILPSSVTSHLNLLYRSIFSPVLNIGAGANLSRPVELGDDSDYVSRTEYQKLWAELDNTRAQLMELKKRYDALGRIRQGLPEPGPVTLVAQVQTRVIQGGRNEIVLNKGQRDYVLRGCYVMGENCVVGTVLETTQTSSRVRLVTDALQKLPVGLWREGMTRYIPGQLVGTGADTCKVPLISKEYDVRKGDAVYATTHTGFLETPIVIGHVSQVEPDPENPLLWDITVRPLFTVDQLEQLAVILLDEGS